MANSNNDQNNNGQPKMTKDRVLHLRVQLMGMRALYRQAKQRGDERLMKTIEHGLEQIKKSLGVVNKK